MCGAYHDMCTPDYWRISDFAALVEAGSDDPKCRNESGGKRDPRLVRDQHLLRCPMMQLRLAPTLAELTAWQCAALAQAFKCLQERNP